MAKARRPRKPPETPDWPQGQLYHEDPELPKANNTANDIPEREPPEPEPEQEPNK